MELSDARRLTGPNLQSDGPGALTEVIFAPDESADAAIETWRWAMAEIGELVPFPLGPLSIRRYRGGAALLCAAPIDALYSALVANEWAVSATIARLGGCPPPSRDAAVSLVHATYADEASPQMRALATEATRRQLPFLWDDDSVSIGFGHRSRTWTRTALPESNEVPWSDLGAIPVVLITGTNGKTTTARLLARMGLEAGRRVGNSSTDGLHLNGHVIDAGDWTGPGAARAILRHPEVEIAVLETARGGILRRGLGVDACDGAVVTNIAADHLGEYGIFDLEDMARAKGLVYSVVAESGSRVINVDDPHLRGLATREPERAILTSLHGLTGIQDHVNRGGAAVYLDGTTLKRVRDHRTDVIIDVHNMPIAHNGAARHDVSNGLAAVALATTIDLPLEAITSALATFGRAWTDNPGRGRFAHLDGVRILLDFGHNPHGADAIMAMARRLAGETGRLGVCIAQAGDRGIDDIHALAHSVGAVAPERVYLRDLPAAYHRGRPPEEVAALLREGLIAMKMPASHIHRVTDEIDALEHGLAWAQPGDLLVHLVHLERDAVEERLRVLGASL